MLSDLLLKMARQEQLTPTEMEQLRQVASSLEDTRTITKSMVGIENKIAPGFLNLPFVPLYSSVFQEATTSVTVQIPSTFTHLLFMGAGRVNTASGGNVWLQFNGDQTNGNYKWTSLFGDGSAGTAATFQDTSDRFASLGLLSDSSDPVNLPNCFFAILPHFRSPWFKQIFSLTGDTELNDIYITSSLWRSVAAIESIRISATDGTLAQDSATMNAGTSISVYGVL